MRRELKKSLGYNKFSAPGIVDRQSVKITERGGVKGYNGLKIKRHKRHVLVDMEAVLLTAHIAEANLNDREGLKPLCTKIENIYQRLKPQRWLVKLLPR